jgi:hypothetical protein
VYSNKNMLCSRLPSQYLAARDVEGKLRATLQHLVLLIFTPPRDPFPQTYTWVQNTNLGC